MNKKPLSFEECFENTVFGIENIDGKKCVHFYGYGYCADDGSTTPYRFLEYTFFIYPLNEVLQVGMVDFEGERQDQFKQYIDDVTENEMVEIYNHYDNGNAPKRLKQLTMETPYGCYIIV